MRRASILAAATLATASSVAQYSGVPVWPASTNPVARAVWTNVAGTAMTGTVKDARADQLDSALDERYIIIGRTADTNNYKPRWYLWERANVVRFKAAASNAMGHFAARWLADDDDFTDYCATAIATNIPRITASNVVAYLALPANFWTHTPWARLNESSNGWDNTKRVVDLMTWTVRADIGGTNETHLAYNSWTDGSTSYGYLYGDNFLADETWANAKAHVDASWGGMTTTTSDAYSDGAYTYTAETNTWYPVADGPARWSSGTWAVDGAATNIRASAASSAYWPASAAVTNYERAADFYHTGAPVGVFDGYSVAATSATLIASVAATYAGTVTVASAMGETGFPKTQPTWCAEPNVDTNSTGRGYTTAAMEWVFRWDATTNGLRFR